MSSGGGSRGARWSGTRGLALAWALTASTRQGRRLQSWSRSLNVKLRAHFCPVWAAIQLGLPQRGRQSIVRDAQDSGESLKRLEAAALQRLTEDVLGHRVRSNV